MKSAKSVVENIFEKLEYIIRSIRVIRLNSLFRNKSVYFVKFVVVKVIREIRLNSLFRKKIVYFVKFVVVVVNLCNPRNLWS